MKHEEYIEQVKFVQRVRHLRHDLLIFSIPNGGYRNPKEAIRLKAEGARAGIPDIHVAKANEEYYGLYLEFKTRKGRVSVVQAEIMEKLKLEGYCVEVVRSCEEAWEFLMEYLRT